MRMQMNNNTQDDVQISIADESDKVAVSLRRKESKIYIKHNCCIYTVPEVLRKGYEDCYRPFIISIGPMFYNDPKLELMQELKLIFLKSFREHPNNAFRSLEPYIDFVREKEEEIRGCYQGKISISRDEFIEMIVLDAVFLIYFFLFKSARSESPSCDTEVPFMNMLHIHKNFLQRDVFLMENQLPFFVLKGIYDIAFGKEPLSFLDLALDFMIQTNGSNGTPKARAIESIVASKKITDESSIGNLLDLRWTCCSLLLTKARVQKRKLRIGSAKQLSAAGVKFKPSDSLDMFDITFDKHTGELKIPKLTLFRGFDALCRNILFFEQFKSNVSFYFFDYIFFFDQLIDTAEDIQILQQSEVLNNRFGPDQDVANLFNNFLNNLPSAGFGYLYLDVSQELKDYASYPFNKWKAILWSRYFNHPWAIISVIYAILLLILTVIQTTSGFTSL